MVSTMPTVLTTTTTSATDSAPSVDQLSFLIENSKSLKTLHETHAHLLRRNLHHHPILNFKLQRSYSSLRRLDLSVALFRRTPSPNVFFYTSLIHSHAVSGLTSAAVSLYSDMLSDGVTPNHFAISAALKLCPAAPGIAIHTHAVKLGLDSDPYVRTALLDVYARAGDVSYASQLFDDFPGRTLVSSTAMIACYARNGNLDRAREIFEGLGPDWDGICWNAMIDGYAQNGDPNEALFLFRRMLKERGHIRPNEATLVSAISACGQIGAEESGRWVHTYAESIGIRIQENVRVATALVDMYCKCSRLDEARRIFGSIREKDAAPWNSMISGCATHGLGREALTLFEEMVGDANCKPNDITFIAILTACAHTGMVAEGRRIFGSMRNEFAIEPKIEHYGCMVNLLSRAGLVDEAYELVKSMGRVEPDPVVWGTLLGACTVHGRAELGEEIAELLVRRGVANSGTYVLLSNIYAGKGDWEGVAKVRSLMRESGVKKEPGCSSIEVNNKVHEFVAGDKKHPKSRDIYAMLEEINSWVRDCGYRPKTEVVLHDLEEGQKRRSLEVHSEKLAMAFGLISTQKGAEIKIMKNLRVCEDCHEVAKLVSKVTGRRIVMRDRSRFHHFKAGSCSCGNYW